MSRFHYTSIATALVAVAIFFLAPAAWRDGALIGCGIFWIAVMTFGVKDPRIGFFVPTLKRLPVDDKNVALTFDDGPDPVVTPALLDYLKDEGIKATFFVIGRRVEAYPEIVRRIVEEGHPIANHSYAHSHFTNFWGARRLHRDFERAQNAIKEIGGLTPKYFRSPVGLTHPGYRRPLKKLGLTMVAWVDRGRDQFEEAEEVSARLLKSASPGAIFVLHDGGNDREKLLQITRDLVDGLREREYHFSPLKD